MLFVCIRWKSFRARYIVWDSLKWDKWGYRPKDKGPIIQNFSKMLCKRLMNLQNYFCFFSISTSKEKKEKKINIFSSWLPFDQNIFAWFVGVCMHKEGGTTLFGTYLYITNWINIYGRSHKIQQETYSFGNRTIKQ